MEVYANILGKWVLLTDEDNINGTRPSSFAERFFIDVKTYMENPTICITHNEIKYVIPICYLQIKNY